MCLPNLTREQAERLREQIRRRTDYLQRLVDRLRKLRWWDDEFFAAANEALARMITLRSIALSAGAQDPPGIRRDGTPPAIAGAEQIVPGTGEPQQEIVRVSSASSSLEPSLNKLEKGRAS